MVIKGINNTAGTLTYSTGTINANSTVTIAAISLNNFIFDPNVIPDIKSGYLSISDTVTIYDGTAAIDFLNRIYNLNIASATTDSGNPFKIATVYNSTNPTFTNGQRADVQSNQFGAINTQFRTTYSRTTGNTTTTAKSGSGTLHGVVIGNNTTGGVATIYDNTAGSGTIIIQLDIGTPSGGLLSSSGQHGPVFLGPLGIEFATGLTIVTTGSSNNDITLVYK